MSLDITVVKANGKHESFDKEKLLDSLLNSGASEERAEEVIAKLAGTLHSGMTTQEIYRHAFEILAGLDHRIARRYSLRRAVMQLGPSGFPFEDFIAELLKAHGFECATRQTVLGGCVPHEVDVVAWNAKKLIMVEAKFHNELGVKSDLKVALYVKARFDDLKENVFNYGGENRKITDAWLVTNTKFSTTALHYAECKGMTLIGWNYPEHGNLQDLIEETKLHPITCLATLSEKEKQDLIAKGVVLCSHVKEKLEVVKAVLGSEGKIEAVLKEVNEV